MTAPVASAPPGRERRLVVVSYHFPPDPSIGGMRWHGLTKYLGRLGWRSWVVTGAPSPAGNGRLARVVVESCPRRTTLNDLYRSVRLGSAPAVAEREPYADLAPADHRGVVRRWFSALRLELSLALSFPDDARGWIWRATRRARRLIERERPDVVVSSGPPHSAHLVAWLATRRTGVRWLVDLRDPWAGPVSQAWRSSPLQRSRVARWLTARLERLVMRSADGVICNTHHLAATIRARHPNVAVVWIPNGVDPELLPTRATDPLPGLAAVHLGTVYGGRDLGPVLEALRRFLDRHPEAPIAGPLLRLAGAIDAPHDRLFRRQLNALGLEPHVQHLGTLSRADALALAARSRLAIVLAQQQELQVPGKLYELVGIGCPTVVIAPEGSASAAEARRIGALVVEGGHVEALVRLMEDVWRGPGPSPDRAHDLVGYAVLAPAAARVLGDHRPIPPR